MIYHNVNFCGRTIEAHDDDSFIECNLSQTNPHTIIASGITGLQFIDCNLTNCDISQCVGVFVSRCNISQVQPLGEGGEA